MICNGVVIGGLMLDLSQVMVRIGGVEILVDVVHANTKFSQFGKHRKSPSSPT
jgi:hypothetical protein